MGMCLSAHVCGAKCFHPLPPLNTIKIKHTVGSSWWNSASKGGKKSLTWFQKSKDVHSYQSRGVPTTNVQWQAWNRTHLPVRSQSVPTVTSVGSGPNTLSLILQGACGPDLAKMLKPVPSFEHGNSPTELVGLNGIGKGHRWLQVNRLLMCRNWGQVQSALQDQALCEVQELGTSLKQSTHWAQPLKLIKMSAWAQEVA